MIPNIPSSMSRHTDSPLKAVEEGEPILDSLLSPQGRLRDELLIPREAYSPNAPTSIIQNCGSRSLRMASLVNLEAPLDALDNAKNDSQYRNQKYHIESTSISFYAFESIVKLLGKCFWSGMHHESV